MNIEYKKARMHKTVYKGKNRGDCIKMDRQANCEKEELIQPYKKARIDKTV